MDATFEGLTAAAREAKRRGLIPAALARKCERLDVAAHYARHTTAAKGAAFIKVLTTALPSPTLSSACHRPTEEPGNDSGLYTGNQEVEEMIDPVATSLCHNGGTTGIGTLIWTMPSTSKPGKSMDLTGGATGTFTVVPTGKGATLETKGMYPTELTLPKMDFGDPAGGTRIASTGTSELPSDSNRGNHCETTGAFQLNPIAKPVHCRKEGMFDWMAESQYTEQRNLRFHLKK